MGGSKFFHRRLGIRRAFWTESEAEQLERMGSDFRDRRGRHKNLMDFRGGWRSDSGARYGGAIQCSASGESRVRKSVSADCGDSSRKAGGDWGRICGSAGSTGVCRGEGGFALGLAKSGANAGGARYRCGVGGGLGKWGRVFSDRGDGK